jgi:hypothetical protein
MFRPINESVSLTKLIEENPSTETPSTTISPSTLTSTEYKNEAKSAASSTHFTITSTASHEESIKRSLAACEERIFHRVASSETIFDEVTSELLGIDIVHLRPLKSATYQIHYETKTRDDEAKNTNFLGWSSDEYLSLRIRNFIQILYHLQKNEFASFNLKHAYTERLIKDPIQYAESCQLLQAEICIALTSLDFNQKVMHTFLLSTSSKREAARQELADSLIKNLSDLKLGEERVLSVGWATHELQIVFKKVRNSKTCQLEIDVVIYNTGRKDFYPAKHPHFGKQRLHPLVNANEESLQPRVVGSIRVENLAPLKEYILNLITVYATEKRHMAVAAIYDYNGNLPFPDPKTGQYTPYNKQIASNCVTYSAWVAQRQRLALHTDFFKWLIDHELRMLRFLSRTTSPALSCPIEVDPNSPVFIISVMLKKNTRHTFISKLILENLITLLSRKKSSSSTNMDGAEQALIVHDEIKPLRYLRLDNINMRDEQLIYLLELISHLPKVREINLSGNHLTQKSVDVLLAFLRSPAGFNISYVKLGNNADIRDASPINKYLSARQFTPTQSVFSSKRSSYKRNDHEQQTSKKRPRINASCSLSTDLVNQQRVPPQNTP